MGVCILGMGECGSTTESINESNKTLINKTLTSMITNTEQKTTAIIKASQTAVIKIKGAVSIIKCPGSLNITQGLKLTQDIKLNLAVNSGNELKNQVANAISSMQTNDSTQKQGFLTTASSEQYTHNNITEVVENVVSNDVWNSTAQSLNSTIDSFQKGQLIVEGPFNCQESANSGNILQNGLVEQLVSTIMDTLYSSATYTNTDTKSETDQVNINKQDNSGFGGMLSGIINTLAGLVGGAMLGTFIFMMCPCIVLICCMCLCCKGKHKKE